MCKLDSRGMVAKKKAKKSGRRSSFLGGLLGASLSSLLVLVAAAFFAARPLLTKMMMAAPSPPRPSMHPADELRQRRKKAGEANRERAVKPTADARSRTAKDRSPPRPSPCR